MTVDEIITEARSWIGVRYRPEGRTRHGIDCLGLLVKLGEHFGVPHQDEPHYSMWPRSDHLILKRCGEYLEQRSMQEGPRPGLVGVFAQSRLPGHAGVFSRQHGKLSLIHARLMPARVCEDSWEAMPRAEIRLIGLYRFPGMVE